MSLYLFSIREIIILDTVIVSPYRALDIPSSSEEKFFHISVAPTHNDRWCDTPIIGIHVEFDVIFLKILAGNFSLSDAFVLTNSLIHRSGKKIADTDRVLFNVRKIVLIFFFKY